MLNIRRRPIFRGETFPVRTMWLRDAKAALSGRSSVSRSQRAASIGDGLWSLSRGGGQEWTGGDRDA